MSLCFWFVYLVSNLLHTAVYITLIHNITRISFHWRTLCSFCKDSFFPGVKDQSLKRTEFLHMSTQCVIITTNRSLVTSALLYILQSIYVYYYIIYCSILNTVFTGTDSNYLTQYCADTALIFCTALIVNTIIKLIPYTIYLYVCNDSMQNFTCLAK